MLVYRPEVAAAPSSFEAVRERRHEGAVEQHATMRAVLVQR